MLFASIQVGLAPVGAGRNMDCAASNRFAARREKKRQVFDSAAGSLLLSQVFRGNFL
jgi:hypothetical protein